MNREKGQPASIRLRPPPPLDVILRPPGSKSQSNRVLLLAAMASGATEIHGLLEAEDSLVMLDCLRRLGIEVELGANLSERVVVHGSGGRMGGAALPERVMLDVATAGTVARFLTAVLAAAPSPTWGSVTIDGSPRMRERPMDTLLDALVDLGAAITWIGRPGALPCQVAPAPSGLRGGRVEFEELASSQFVSALVLAATFMRSPLRMILRHGTPARPYVDMTLAELARFGGRARWLPGDELEIDNVPLQAPVDPIEVEPDASAASYLLALPLIWGGCVRVPDLGRNSVQGDARFCDVLARFGGRVEQGPDWTTVAGGNGLIGCDLDLVDMPDMTLTAAVVGLFARGPTRIRGVGILRHHESDRLAVGALELRKLGAEVIEHDDGLEIHPPSDGPRRGVAIETWRDHRMAMAFALVGDVEILDPGCVAKTYPGFFDDLVRCGMTLA